LIFSKSLTQPESVMDDVAYSSTAGLPPRWLEPLRIAAHDLTQRLLEASAALSTWQASESRGDELAELARDLSEEGQRQADAAREVAALLA